MSTYMAERIEQEKEEAQLFFMKKSGDIYIWPENKNTSWEMASLSQPWPTPVSNSGCVREPHPITRENRDERDHVTQIVDRYIIRVRNPERSPCWCGSRVKAYAERTTQLL
uniref:Uncharacterized protein n=1 Tax=Branchiostoma floridae TaxID=7739 RepID=C3Y842_BRAFL|eukprot:XP_002607501.1 hypothetical protein BRAFLDRAFT_69932 [Branchiostoma floridae]